MIFFSRVDILNIAIDETRIPTYWEREKNKTRPICTKRPLKDLVLRFIIILLLNRSQNQCNICEQNKTTIVQLNNNKKKNCSRSSTNNNNRKSAAQQEKLRNNYAY